MQKKKVKKYYLGGGQPIEGLSDAVNRYKRHELLNDSYIKPERDLSFLDERVLPEPPLPKNNDMDLMLGSNILKSVNFGVGAIAGKINDLKNTAKERKTYFDSLQKVEDSTFVQNDIPLYVKFGGGFPREAAFKILREKEVNGKPLTDKQRKFFATMAFAKKKAQYGDGIEEMKEGGIPDRYKKMGFTRVGQKKDGDGQKKWKVLAKKGDKYKIVQGGYRGMEDYSQHKNKDRQKRFWDRMGGKDSAKANDPFSPLYWHKKLGKWATGGEVLEVQGLPEGMEDQAWIEAEAGEMIQDTNGQVLKISEDGNRHEEGGELLSNVQRVLEDTSTTRKDNKSRSLQISPDTIEDMFGIIIKNPVSHSEALELVNKDLNKRTATIKRKLTKSEEVLEETPNNKYAKNSLELGIKELSKYPTKEDIFEVLFQHQESTKQENSMKQAKYGICLPKAQDGLEVLYKKASVPNASKEDIRAFQKAFHSDTRTYGYAEKLVNERANVTNYGKKMGYGKGHVGQNEDGLMGDTTRKYFDYFNQNIVNPPAPQPESDEYDKIGASTSADYDIQPIAPNEPVTPGITSGVTPQSAPQPRPIRHSDFNEPLGWTDILAPAAAYLSADRIPANYNPSNYKKIDPRMENVLPYLQQGQRDFNAITNDLGNSGTGQANAVNLFAQKYAVDTNTMATVADRNLQRQASADLYNTQVSDKQSDSDQKSRSVFEQQQLLGMEAQRQQKLKSLDEIMQRVNLNKKQNREGNLLMKLFRNFNSYGDYNGVETKINPNTATGNSSSATNSSRFQTVPVQLPNGQVSLFTIDMMDPKQRPVSNNKDMTNTRQSSKPKYITK